MARGKVTVVDPEYPRDPFVTFSRRPFPEPIKQNSLSLCGTLFGRSAPSCCEAAAGEGGAELKQNLRDGMGEVCLGYGCQCMRFGSLVLVHGRTQRMENVAGQHDSPGSITGYPQIIAR